MKTLKATRLIFGGLIGGIAVLGSAAALAHPGDASVHGLVAGLAHPFLGIDHLLAMIAVGLLASQGSGRAVWMTPSAFVAAMLVGASLSFGGAPLPLVEPVILVSVLALGGLVLAAFPLPAWSGPLLVAGFGLFHGHAHGTELAADASAFAYAAGFLASTAALHASGLAFALLGQRLSGDARGARLTRLAGAAIVAGGSALAFGA